ncbi:PEP-CTERM sorting domain-containing protein [Aquabacterium sp.]|uniref:PEP-CTERM sorting domain-containing protein n=1 Tax=Aquabacterium sp. TaxID=1872578 RepID=UPI002CE597A2|nr:PEP-CTERM sorting domain-containing protein [Aquabacterium sp.]HSW05086.1 PEP-CTERM sorting domain-containing protein [Aquabacterium sp.]
MKTASSLCALLLALGASALSGLAPQAHAAIVVQDLDFVIDAIAAHDGTGPWVVTGEKTAVFKQFEPGLMLGTLTAARWELTSTWGAFGAAAVQSGLTDPSAVVSGALKVEVGLDTRVNFGGSLLGTGGQYFSSYGQASQDCSTTLALGPCNIQLEFTNIFDGAIDVSDLAALTGSGEFVQGVEAALQLTNTIAGLASMSSAGELTWSEHFDRGPVGRLRLVYEYELTTPSEPPGSVPEPSSLALAVLALAALRRAGRKR